MDWPNLTPGPIPPFLFYVSNKFAETAFNQSFQFYANFQVKLFVLLLHFKPPFLTLYLVNVIDNHKNLSILMDNMSMLLHW